MGATNGEKVLRTIIVDSDRRSRIHSREHLSNMGVRVIAEADTLKTGLRLVRGLQPDAVLLEIAANVAEATEAIKAVRDEQPNVGIIISSTDAAPDFILSCVRAGAQEFITRPIELEALRTSVDHLQHICSKPTTSGRKRGRVISVFASKGGVGATSVVANLGVALSHRSEAKTVLVDLSFHMGDLGLMLDQPPKYSLVDAMENGVLDEGKLQTVVAHHPSGVHILTCVTSPEMSEEVSCDHLVEMVGTLSTLYDYVIIDVGRHIDDRTVDVIEVSDEVLIMASQDITTIRNVSRYMSIFDRLELDTDRFHLVINRFHKRSRVALKELESALEMETFWSIPNDYEPMSHAIDVGVPAVLEAPRSKVAQSFKDLAEHLVELRERQSTSKTMSPTS